MIYTTYNLPSPNQLVWAKLQTCGLGQIVFIKYHEDCKCVDYAKPEDILTIKKNGVFIDGVANLLRFDYLDSDYFTDTKEELIYKEMNRLHEDLKVIKCKVEKLQRELD